MVIYWDSSALVSLLARESAATDYCSIAREFGIVTWWGSYVECAAAIARHSRDGSTPSQIAESYRVLDRFAEEWREIMPGDGLRRRAVRAAKNHGLRAGDALQLGAALIASGFEPHTVRFLSGDLRLKAAAEREGFLVD